MSIFLTLLIGLSSILISKKLFHKWFNHLFIYSCIWMLMVFLYELKLIAFTPLSNQTWAVIIFTFLFFVLGILSIITARLSFNKQLNIFEHSTYRFEIYEDKSRILKIVILICGIIGLLAALQHWKVLLDQYGTVTNVFINSFAIYRERLEGDIKGVTPYIWLISYLGVFFGGLHSAYKNKITLISLIPLIAVLLKELARFTRSGILLGLFLFIVTFFLMRHALSKQTFQKSRSRVRIIFTALVVILIMFIGASAVKIFRSPTEDFRGTSRGLSQFKGGIFISPSLYFYAASHIGVLNKYLEKDNEMSDFGSNTFFTFYSIFEKFDFVKRPDYQSKGYYIPMWSNSATYLRDLHADFGYFGLFLFPYLLGLLTTYFWFQFYEKQKLIYFVILVHLYLIICLSFFIIITKVPAWSINLLFLLLLIPLLERIAKISQRLLLK